MTQRSRKKDILGLDEPSAYNDLALYSDPFDMVYETLSDPEKELVDTGRFHILAERALQVKGAIGDRLLGDLSVQEVDVFVSALQELDIIAKRVQGTDSQAYAESFAHRSKQRLAKNLERMGEVAADGIIREAGRTVYPSQEDEDARKKRARNMWQRLVAAIRGQ